MGAHPLQGFIEETRRQAAKLQVRRQHGGGRLDEGCGIPLWLLKRRHPALVR